MRQLSAPTLLLLQLDLVEFLQVHHSHVIIALALLVLLEQLRFLRLNYCIQHEVEQLVYLLPRLRRYFRVVQFVGAAELLPFQSVDLSASEGGYLAAVRSVLLPTTMPGASWYSANSLYQSERLSSDLVLVTSYTKTTQWAFFK